MLIGVKQVVIKLDLLVLKDLDIIIITIGKEHKHYQKQLSLQFLLIYSFYLLIEGILLVLMYQQVKIN